MVNVMCKRNAAGLRVAVQTDVRKPSSTMDSFLFREGQTNERMTDKALNLF